MDLKILLDHIPSQIWLLKDPETYEMASKAHADFVGKDCNSMEGCKIRDLLDKEQADHFIHENEEVFRKRKITEKEYRMRDASGRWRTLRVKKTPVPGEAGDIGYVLCSAEDITERSESMRELKAWDELLEYVIRHFPHGIAIHDKEMHYMYVSDRYLEEYRVKEKDIIGRHHYDVFPDIPDKWRSVHQRALQGKVSRSDDDIFHREDGTTDHTRWECRPWYRMDGQIGGIIIYTEVITRQKEQELRNRTLYETMSQGVIYLQANGDIAAANPAAEKILGLSSAQLLGKTSLDPDWKMTLEDGTPVPGDDHPAKQSLRSGRKVGPVIRGIYNPEKKDHIWLEITSTPLFLNGEEKPFLAYAIFEDITGRKRTEEFMKQSLEEKNILLSEIHHRVKNNMAIITSLLTLQTEFLFKKKDTKSLLQDTCNRIKSMALAHEMVYEHQDHVRIHFPELLKQLVEQLQKIYRKEGDNVKVVFRTDKLLLDTNNSIPLSLLANELIINAFKHAFNGLSEGLITVQLERKEEEIIFAVEDNGLGVDDIEELRQPESFGYTIIHGLVGQLRGNIRLLPLDKGLRVEIHFPVATFMAKTGDLTNTDPGII